jgi:DNA-damage-inducible protein J
MTTRAINFRIDEELKAKAEVVLSEMGLTMSSALNIFLQQMVNKRALPFAVEAADPFFSKINQELLERRLEKYAAGKKIERELIEVD